MKRFLSLLGIFLLLTPAFVTPKAQATTSYTTFNIPPTRLKTRISSTQTTGIKLNPPSRNGADVSWPALSGGILFFQQGTREEYIYFSRATVDGDLVVTLTGSVVRDIPWNQATSFTGQGDGSFFHPGAAVTFVVSAQLLNLKVDKDRVNTITGSGSIECASTNQACLVPGSFTTAQRDAFTYKKASTVIRNTTLGVLQWYDGGSWLTLATQTGSFVNASETAAGKVQLGTVSDQSGATLTGSTGAPTVVQTRYLTASGGSTMRKRIPILDNRGFMSGSTLAPGTRNSTVFLRGDQTWSRPSASGVTLFATKNVPGKITGLDSTTFTTIDGANLTSAVTGLSVGDMLTLNFRGSITRTGGDPKKVVVDFQVGNNPISANGSGAITFLLDQATGINDANMSFTKTIQVLTGGTLTVQPIYRVYVGGGASIRFNDNTGFDVIKAH